MGPKTAEKIKRAWEVAHGGSPAGPTGSLGASTGGGAAGLTSSPGLTMEQLLGAPPDVGFAWGPATRCYSPHLHAAEQVGRVKRWYGMVPAWQGMA